MTKNKLKVLDLFSGIGGFSLGLERTGGFETVAFCEIDKYCQKVLRKHWNNVPIFNDISEITNDKLNKQFIKPTVVTGGFPCQDISLSGGRKGIIGKRSGLWNEMFRVIKDVQPQWAIIENVSPLRSKGLTLVLQNLSEVGYHAEWHCVPASAIGAPHQRDRIWIVAYPDSGFISCPRRSSLIQRYVLAKTERNEKADGFVFDDFGKLSEGTINNFKAEHWLHQSPRCRMVDGLPKRLDKNRLKQLGNSLVPQIPQLIGYAILEYEKDINK